MIITGKGKIKADNEILDCWIEFDPEEAQFEISFNTDAMLHRDFELLSFSGSIPLGDLEKGDFGKPFIKRQSTSPIDNRSQLLKQNPSKRSLTELLVIPQNKIVTFNLVRNGAFINSEIELRNINLGFHQMTADLAELQIKLHNDVANRRLVIKSDHDLSLYKEGLTIAISVLQGGRCDYFSAVINSTLEFGTTRSKSNPYGPSIIEKHTPSFINKFVSYYQSLGDSPRYKFELFIGYFLDSMNQTVYLENRIINLFVALEIIDNNKTLTKDSLSKTLEIDLNLADFLNRLRNTLVHNGLGLLKAFDSVKKTLEHQGVEIQFPFRIEGRNRGAAAYFFLLTKTYEHILRLIEIDDVNINYKKHYL